MRKIVLYTPRPIVGQDFEGAKVHTVPNQSLTLKQILHRFVRRESIPAEKQGIYFESEYDLEKVMQEDMVVQSEILQEVKADVQKKKRKVEDMQRPPASPDPNPPIPPTG